ncbi:hypothetical protein [Pedobacter hartonius]|uniref:Uncharacterized protein n=1 Tax=Pedobacter hartonius TaxID=425514 RepID=A0A1H4CRB7_9SPHI|nr:hypothetical protein [Pedobacter hartonius]SEA62662.1 hypothetical protein SAMN05443550_104143 [Pedobacter hartonius]
MDDKKSLIRKEKLDYIIAAYAEIWAEVMLDKNLDLHLLQVEDDLRYLDHLINSKDADHPQTFIYYTIANDLIRLKKFLDKQLKRHDEL